MSSPHPPGPPAGPQSSPSSPHPDAAHGRGYGGPHGPGGPGGPPGPGRGNASAPWLTILAVGCGFLVLVGVAGAVALALGWNSLVRFGINDDLANYVDAAARSDLPEEDIVAFEDVANRVRALNEAERIGALDWATAFEPCDDAVAEGRFTAEQLAVCHRRLERLID